MNTPDVPGGVGGFSILLLQQWRHVCQPSAEVKQDGGKPESEALPFWLLRDVAPTRQVEGESLIKQPGRQEPPEIVDERNTEVCSAIMPYLGFRNRRRWRVHHEVPLRHDEGGSDGQNEDIKSPMKAPVRAVEQRRRHDP